MRTSSITAACLSLAAVLAAPLSCAATSSTLDSDPVVKAIRHRDCHKALAALNAIADHADAGHALSLFVGGRMLDEGICVPANPDGAALLFERSAQLGNQSAQLEFATKIGMGQGTAQDYVIAGQTCHRAGVDPGGLVPFYSVGYACTVGGVAGRLLRTSLPQGAFRQPTQPAIVEFNPTTSEIHVVSAPKSQSVQAAFSNFVSRPLVDTNTAIEKAIHDALAVVPKPEAASLTSDTITLTVDLDASIEGGTGAPVDPNGQMLPPESIEMGPAG